MARARRPTTFLTKSELFAIADQKTQDAAAMPVGECRDEMLVSANMYRRLGDLRKWLNSEAH